MLARCCLGWSNSGAGTHLMLLLVGWEMQVGAQSVAYRGADLAQIEFVAALSDEVGLDRMLLLVVYRGDVEDNDGGTWTLAI
ncbi:hypothetical protein ACLOJK_037135 [Asimina triloba]